MSSASPALDSEASPRNRHLTPSLAVIAGLSISTIYMVQPVLGLIADEFRLSPGQLSQIPTAMQAAYALGLLVVVPLADVVDTRLLIRLMLLGLGLSLVALCLASSLPGLLAASVCLGITATVTQTFVPIAARWAMTHERARAIGTVVSGILCGILLSRVVSGYLGGKLGWRAAYLLDAGLLASACMILAKLLPAPATAPSVARRWHEAWQWPSKGMGGQVLWHAIGTQGLLFAAMMALWNTMGLHMAYSMPGQGAAAAGMLGFAGLAGIVAAPRVGRAVDRFGTRPVTLMAIACHGIGFVCLTLLAPTWQATALGLVLIDLGVHSSHIANQSGIQAQLPQASHRLNSLFMGGVFVCGAVGSWLGLQLYNQWAWLPVCIMGMGCATLALAITCWKPR